jgi:hypothetical protein
MGAPIALVDCNNFNVSCECVFEPPDSSPPGARAHSRPASEDAGFDIEAPEAMLARSEPSDRHDRAARVAWWGSRCAGPRHRAGTASAFLLLRSSCALSGFYEASKQSRLGEEPREECVQCVGRKPEREFAFGRF